MNIKELGETHLHFYQTLKECVTHKTHKKIGEIFLEYKEKFLKYGDYCSDLPKAQEKLAQLYEKDTDVRKEIEECEKARKYLHMGVIIGGGGARALGWPNSWNYTNKCNFQQMHNHGLRQLFLTGS